MIADKNSLMTIGENVAADVTSNSVWSHFTADATNPPNSPPAPPSILTINFPGALWLGFLGIIVSGVIDIILFLIGIVAAIGTFFSDFQMIFHSPKDCLDALDLSIAHFFQNIPNIFNCLGKYKFLFAFQNKNFITVCFAL
jgi:hypothetical protein